MKSALKYCRNLRYSKDFGPESDLRFFRLYGVYVEEETALEYCLSAFLVFLIGMFSMKVIFGNWGIVFAAGSFFVAIPMLILAVLNFKS